VGYNTSRCIGREACRERCLRSCETGALQARADGSVAIDVNRCEACARCVRACPAEAFKLYGEGLSVADVLAAVEEDGLFYARSGGGLTVSGGEPLVQARFAARLLAAARERGLDTAIETSGCGRWEDLERVCRHVDQVFYDVKTLDPERHREWTGVGNERILANLRRLCETFPELPVVVRTPVVPGFNDDVGSIRAIADFLERLPRPVRYELLPYHGFGESKYAQLGRSYALAGLEPPARARMAELARVAEEARRDRT
jgi:pyruvate formate lyase activating enzyme